VRSKSSRARTSWAVARAVLALMPDFEKLVIEAGLESD
jgi:hypothetical protein